MKTNIIILCSVLLTLIVSINAVKAQDREFSLFVKLDEATVVHEKTGILHTWYIWEKALLNETKPGKFQRRYWCKFPDDVKTIIKLDSATWELNVKTTLLGDDGEKITISYHSFDIPVVVTESKKFGWMTYASCEAGGYFYENGYKFDMKFYEQRQDFRFKRITAFKAF